MHGPPEAKRRDCGTLIQGGAEESRPRPRPVPHSPGPLRLRTWVAPVTVPSREIFLDSPLRGERLRLRPIGALLLLLLLRPPRKRPHNFRGSRKLILLADWKLVGRFARVPAAPANLNLAPDVAQGLKFLEELVADSASSS